MKVKLIRSYRSKNGNVTFVYGVTCNAVELKAYKKAQGEFFRETEDGTPLWFTTRCIGDAGSLLISQDGAKVYPDMSEFDQLASIVEQYGGNLGDHLAATAAAKLIGGSSTPATPVASVSASSPSSL